MEVTMFKLIIKYLIRGIGWGCFLFVLNSVIYDLVSAETLQVIFDNFTANVISFLALGIAVGGGSVIYELERFHFGINLVIHIAVVTVMILIIGFITNPNPLENPTVLIGTLILNALLVCVIWGGVYLHDRREVQKINKKLKEMKIEQIHDIMKKN
jgi:hypothetical protein